MHSEALESKLRATGEEDPNTLMRTHNHAALLMDDDRLEEAEDFLKRTIAKRTQLIGANAGNTIRSRIRFAVLVTRLGRPGEAEPMLRELLTDVESSLEPGHIDRGALGSVYGECLAALDRMQEAEEYLLSGYEKAKVAGGRSNPTTRCAVERLVRFYTTTNRSASAAQWQAQLLSEGFP